MDSSDEDDKPIIPKKKKKVITLESEDEDGQNLVFEKESPVPNLQESHSQKSEKNEVFDESKDPTTSNPNVEEEKSGPFKKNTFIGRKKHSSDEKKEVGKIVAQFKLQYDEKSTNQKVYDFKKKKFVLPAQKEGYIAKAVRSHFDDLKDLPNSNLHFQAARKFAERCFKDYKNPETEEFDKKRFRKPGAGRKTQALDVREGLFGWFVDVRDVFKARLPKNLLVMKATELYTEWLKQQSEPPEKLLKFSNCWISAWLKEYGLSLRKPNKRFAISQQDRKERIEEYLKNMWRLRKYHLQKYGKEPVIINGDQMPLHRNESSGQKTVAHKNFHVYVKENYMLNRERATCFTQVSSDPKLILPLEFVFKGKGMLFFSYYFNSCGDQVCRLFYETEKKCNTSLNLFS